MKNITVKDLENKIKLLLLEEKHTEAHQMCQEILRITPDNPKIIKLKNQIEKKVKKINTKAIENELKQINKFKEKGEYKKYLESLRGYQHYIKDFPILIEKITEAANLYKKDIAIKKKKAQEKELEEIQKALLDEQIDLAMDKIVFLEKSQKPNKEIKERIEKLKEKIIRKKISEKENLLKSDKYEDIIVYLAKLKRIKPDSKPIQKELIKIKKKYKAKKREDRKDEIFRMKEELITLLKQNKFLLAMTLAEKLYFMDKEDQSIEKLYKKTKKKFDNKMNSKIKEQIHCEHIKNKAIYKENKNKYIKI